MALLVAWILLELGKIDGLVIEAKHKVRVPMVGGQWALSEVVTIRADHKVVTGVLPPARLTVVGGGLSPAANAG